MSAGQLDTSFGSPDGYAGTSFDGTSDDSAFAQIKDSNGKLVIAGFSSNGATIERFDTNGSPDTSFGGGDGIVYIDPAKMVTAHSIVEDNGGYVLGGGTENHAPSFVRLDSSGALDAGFGSNGATIVNAPEQGAIDGVIIDGTGHVAGMLTYENDSSFSAVRLTANGNVDPSFGTNGIATHSFAGSGGDTAYAILDNGNSILLAGDSFQTSTNTLQPAFAQFNSSGNLDSSFGPGGDEVLTSPTIGSATIHTIAHDGAFILTAGQAHFGNDPMCAIRISTGGSLDTSFGNGNAQAIVSVPNTFVRSVGRDNQGRIYLMGNSGGNYAVARLDSGGITDQTYGGGNVGYNVFLGVGFPSMGYVDASVNPLVDGTVHMVGTTSGIAGDADWQRVSIDPSGTSESDTPTSFQGPQNAAGQAVALQGSNIVVAGLMTPYGSSTSVLALARYDTHGILLTQASQEISGFTVMDAHGVVVDSSGNIYVGFTAQSGDNDFGVAKFDSSGNFVNSWIDSAAGQDNQLAGMALSSDGSHIYIGGTADGNFEFDSFDVAGHSFNSHAVSTGGTGQLGGIAIASNGDVILAGTAVSGTAQIALVELAPNGGTVVPLTTTNNPGGLVGLSVAVSGSNIFVGGLDASTGNSTLFKFNSSFTLQSSSGVSLGGVYLTSLAVAPSGTIVAAASSTDSRFAVVRFDSSGAVDPTFGTGGVSLVSVEGPGTVGGLAIQSNNMILVAGTGGQGAFSGFAVARLDGSVAQNNTPPSPTINGAPANSPEGTPINLTSLTGDPDVGDSFTYSWSVTKNGNPYATGSNDTFSFTPDDNGTYVVSLSVDDGHGAVNAPNKTINVTNVAPTASITGPSSLMPGQSGTFTLLASDPSTVDQAANFTFKIDWDGNGTVDQTVVAHSGTTVAHTYFATGSNTIKVNATDEDGQQSASPGTKVVNVTAPVTVNAQVVSDPLNAGQTMLLVNGTSGNDDIKLTVNNANTVVTVQVGSVVIGTYSPTSRIVVFANDGDDQVTHGGGFKRAVELYGGNGDDTLKAGQNGDILVGGAGGDSLVAGAGDDLLVGGGGADKLTAGGGEDILIAGFTSFDNDPASLNKISAEWQSTRSLQSRIGNLTGNNPNTTDFNNRLNGTVYLLADVPSATVFDDAAKDTTNGGGGADWFLINISGGGVVDKVAGAGGSAVVTDI